MHVLCALVLAWVGGACVQDSPREAGGAGEGDDRLALLVLERESGELPPGWKPHQFQSIPRHTEFRVEVDSDGVAALRAHSVDAASALRRAVEIAPAERPWIAWQWKVERGLPGSDPRVKARDDCAARVMLLYRFDPEEAGVAERFRYRALEAAAGEPPPAYMLVYAWTDAVEPGALLKSPHSERVRLIALRGGDELTERWLSQRRNHHEDFRRAFGKEPPPIAGVALMADTDDTHGETTAWFRGLAFERN
jgi:hypothetical protein